MKKVEQLKSFVLSVAQNAQVQPLIPESLKAQVEQIKSSTETDPKLLDAVLRELMILIRDHILPQLQQGNEESKKLVQELGKLKESLGKAERSVGELEARRNDVGGKLDQARQMGDDIQDRLGKM